MSEAREFVELAVAGQALRIETHWVGAPRDDARAPLLVFLHEGLGSVSMWREFPARLCEAGGYRGLVYSRPGYGRSTPRPANERWRPDFMHRQAREVLPALLAACGIDASRQRPWLLGHSDGGSIALLHAAHAPQSVRGVIALAPHLFVEDISVRSIADARTTFETTALREKLARHHDDVDSAFYGWNDIWLDPVFRDWNIEAEVEKLQCPVLAIQGVDDEYGTMAQIETIARLHAQTRLLKLEACGHSPHRDQVERVAEAVVGFVAGA